MLENSVPQQHNAKSTKEAWSHIWSSKKRNGRQLNVDTVIWTRRALPPNGRVGESRRSQQTDRDEEVRSSIGLNDFSERLSRS